LLAYPGKLILGISEFLTSGLKPPFQLRDLSVSSSQVIRCPGKLSLKIIPLLGCLALDLRQLFCQALLLRTSDANGSYAERLFTIPNQHARLDFEDFQRALLRLRADQREALLLIGAEGFSYEEAAEICGCAVGTIKSRVNRARNRLAELLSLDDTDGLGPDKITMAALPTAA
jgi:hypothetical protein